MNKLSGSLTIADLSCVTPFPSPLILSPVMASIEKQNGQHSQYKEANGKMSYVAQVRTYKHRE
jgi:hypothetical protein